MRSCITINIGKKTVTIKIAEESTQEQIVESIKKKLNDIKKASEQHGLPIRITGKILKNQEIEEIKQLLGTKIDSKLEFDTPTSLGLHGIKKTFDKEIESSETKFHRGSLRSGNRIEYEGSLVILGDVNHGAEVIASDNIVVVGYLRGMAHAGAKGNKKAVIAAASIEAPQLRIANIVKEIEKEEIEERKTYASVEEEKIILE